jgi:hypothetical protein
MAAAHPAILRTAALLVPKHLRSEWLVEWRSEWWYVSRQGRLGGAVFCLGAFQDALWLRWSCRPGPCRS